MNKFSYCYQCSNWSVVNGVCKKCKYNHNEFREGDIDSEGGLLDSDEDGFSWEGYDLGGEGGEGGE